MRVLLSLGAYGKERVSCGTKNLLALIRETHCYVRVCRRNSAHWRDAAAEEERGERESWSAIMRYGDWRAERPGEYRERESARKDDLFIRAREALCAPLSYCRALAIVLKAREEICSRVRDLNLGVDYSRVSLCGKRERERDLGSCIVEELLQRLTILMLCVLEVLVNGSIVMFRSRS